MTKNKMKLQQSSTNEKSACSRNGEETLFTFMTNVIDRLIQLNQFGTAHNYKAAFQSFRKFRNGINLKLEHLDSVLIEDYQTFLKISGLTPNSISFYLRILRAVYNRAVERGFTKDQHPFKSVFTGMEKTRKRAIRITELKQIKSLDLRDNPSLNFARDIFLFLFYCRGMSFIDAAYLKKSDIRNGVLTYRRHKTGQRIDVKIIHQIGDFIERYSSSSTGLLLPIITQPDNNERRQYESALRKINRNLKIIGEKASLSIPLTTYVARHSWATLASTKGIPINIISDALGHESIATTQIYLASIDSSIIDQANEIVLNGL